MKKLNILIYTILTLLSITNVAAKSFVLYGRVTDSSDKSPLVGATVINESGAGVITDIDGNFKIAIADTPSSIYIEFMGYTPEEVKVTALKQNIKVELQNSVIEIDNVVVKGRRKRSRDEYAWYIHSRIVENKEHNNPDHIAPIKFSDYERASIFYMQANKGYKRDTTQSPYNYIPVILNEKVTHESRSAEEREREVVTTKSNVLLESVANHIDMVLKQKIAVDMNFYDNQINLLGRGFPSPISSNASAYYRLYLIDSTELNGHKIYNLRYYPKSNRSTTFIGDFSVDAESWAVTNIDAKLPNSANLNFVSNFSVGVEYQQIDECGRWFRDKQRTNMDLTLTGSAGAGGSVGGVNDLLHFRLQRNNSYSLLAQSTEQESPAIEEQILLTEREKMPLNAEEESAENKIREMKKSGFNTLLDKSTNMLVSAHFNIGKFDLGPYYGLYRNTLVEGHRISVPIRTSEKMFKNFSVGGYLAYGFGIKELGWSANTHVRIPTKRRFILSAEAYDDYYELGQQRFIKFIQENPYNQGSGNFLSSVTSYRPNPYMIRRSAVSITADYELFDNLGLTIRPSFERYSANEAGRGYTPYLQFNKAGESFSHIDTRTMLFDLRYSKDQNYEDKFFDRVYYGNEHPIFHASLIAGKYSLAGAEKSSDLYAQTNFTMKWRKIIGPMLMLSLLEGGCIVGDVPYPLLDMPRGSGDMGSARFHYNLLDHASFASDTYAHAHITLNMGGVILSKLPLIRALNMREVVGFKAYYGRLGSGHASVLDMPTFLHRAPGAPYMEYSVGLSNIFQLLRIEYVRSLSPSIAKQNYASKHGIKLRVEFEF